MTEHKTFPGKTYCVTCAEGCTVTDSTGALSMECEAGKQLHLTAPSDKLFTSASAIVREVFKLAPAKSKALGLLGGGENTLPSGCIPAAWLIFDGSSYIDTEVLPADDVGMRAEITFFYQHDRIFAGARGDGETRFFMSRPYAAGYKAAFGWNSWNYLGRDISVSKEEWFTPYLNFNNSRMVGIKTQNDETKENIKQTLATVGFPIYIGGANIKNSASLLWTGNCKSFQITKGKKIVRDLIPVLQEGKPAFFDKESKKVFLNTQNAGLGVGLTLAQARKLSRLPAGGGTLKVSLPSNYLENEGVVNAIAEANAKGWNIEVASTWDASAASATFALRRIWVRKTRAEQGNYVAADGTRWAVESCVAMYNADGSEPDAHGYEPFRSVDAAVAYWELEPYVNPEEELLTEL